MRPMGLIGLLGLVGLMVGCTNDEEPPMAKTTDVPVAEVRSYATFFDEYIAKTRAWTIPDGYEAYEDGAQTIGFAFTQNDKDPIYGTFYKSGNWRMNVDPTKSVEDIVVGTYYLYGYIPHTSGIQLEVYDRNSNTTNYSNGAKVKLTNVPTVMPKDLCVVIGAKDGSSSESDNDLRMGDFTYTAKTFSKDGDGGNYVFLLFDHLYAALRISMRVHPDYAALRTIKLKVLQLSTKAGEAKSAPKTTITVDLATTDGSVTPIQDITYTGQGDPVEDGLPFWSSSTGEKLTTTFTARVGHFMPHNISTLVLTSIYDVYDTKNNLIRENCKVTNTMVLKDLFTGQETTKRGYSYTVNMTIQPTYLYMLSDPDLDNPTVTVSQ